MVGKDKTQNLHLVPSVPAAEALFLECTFRDFQGALLFSVDPKDRGRINTALASGQKSFLALETLDGRAVYLNLEHLQNCRISQGEHAPNGPKLDILVCHLFGSENVEVANVNSNCVDGLDATLKEYEEMDGRFILILDDPGMTTAINMTDIVFLEFPSSWHDISTASHREKNDD